MQDLDSTVGLWLNNVPYWWSPGTSLETSRRFYLVDLYAAAVFDGKNRITDPHWAYTEMSNNHVSLSETFCFFAINGVDRNMNLMYICPLDKDFPYKKAELRVNGHSVLHSALDRSVTFSGSVVTLIDTTGPVRSELLYPWEFGRYDKVHNTLMYWPKYYKDPRRFANLAQVKDGWKLSVAALVDIHDEAAYGNGDWRYLWNTKDYKGHESHEASHIIFETLTGERPAYPLRCSVFKPQRRPTVALQQIPHPLKRRPLNTEYSIANIEKRISKRRTRPIKKLPQHCSFLISPPTEVSLKVKEVKQPPEFAEIETKLNAAKAAMDPYEDDPELSEALRAVDIYAGLKSTVARHYNGQVVTNAWLKMYEIATQDLVTAARTALPTGSVGIGNAKYTHTLRAFCNAELPGAFICALNHLLCTQFPETRFDWVGSSLYPEPSDGDILGDDYGLYSQNPDRWLMSPEMRGDVTKVADIRALVAKAKARLGKVDIYTSDAGIGVSEDYNRQEELTAHINLGQILTGLASLRTGGVLAVKTYTFVHPFSLSLIGICASLFDKFYITKPLTSRPANSEVYFVGIGYHGLPEDLEERLYDAVEHFDFTPIISIDDSAMIESALNAARQIHMRQQVDFVKEAISFYRAYRGRIKNLRQTLREVSRQAQAAWLKENPIKRITPGCLVPDSKHPKKQYKGIKLDKFNNDIVTLNSSDKDHETLRGWFPDEIKDKQKLQVVKSSIYSLSHKDASEYLSQSIKVALNEDTHTLTITDATANVGGNTLNFAKHFKEVTAVEIDENAYQALENNIEVAGHKNVDVICGNYLDMMNNLSQDVIFFDPPWGGPDYWRSKALMLKLGGKPIWKIINDITVKPKLIVIKAPKNFAYAEFKCKVNSTHVLSNYCSNHQMIFIHF